MPLHLVLIKKNQQLHSRSQYWNDNEAAPANGGFVHKANHPLRRSVLYKGHIHPIVHHPPVAIQDTWIIIYNLDFFVTIIDYLFISIFMKFYIYFLCVTKKTYYKNADLEDFL